MRRLTTIAPALLLALASCGGAGGAGAGGERPTGPSPSPAPAAAYQPLASGDRWNYACSQRNPPNPGAFTIANRVSGTQSVGGVRTYAFALQVVTSPAKIATETMLLANDTSGNTTLYGYVQNGAVLPVTPTVIVAADPSAAVPYTYPALGGGTITRVFKGFSATNPTPLGVFEVAVYYESGGTHNYGYAAGKGIMEEDHGPNLRYDCLIDAMHVR